MTKIVEQEYQFTVKALYRQEESFEKLVKEMQNFKPPSLTQEQMEKKRLYKEQLYSINNVKEGEQDEDLDKDVHLQFDTKYLVSHLYEEDFNYYCTILPLLSCAVIESYINLYITIKTNETNTYELFCDIEKIDLYKKWAIVPRLFVSSYEFNKGKSTGQSLGEIIGRRNRIVHYKPKLTIIDKIIHCDSELNIVDDITLENSNKLKGEPLNRDSFSKEVKLMRNCFSLPKKLLTHLFTYEPSSELIYEFGLTDEECKNVLRGQYFD
ncbi:MAG: hypothetical protein ACK6C7_20065 [Pseudanabaena sp.]|jgi:hypothetical protein